MDSIMEEFKEREVGEVFEYEGVTLKCVEDIEIPCNGCYFWKDINCPKDLICFRSLREEKTDVKFIKQ